MRAILGSLTMTLTEKIERGEKLAIDPFPETLAHKFAYLISALGSTFTATLGGAPGDVAARLFIGLAADLLLAAEAMGVPIGPRRSRNPGLVTNVTKEYRGTVHSISTEQCAYTALSSLPCQPSTPEWWVLTLGGPSEHGMPEVITRTPACFRHAAMVTASWRKQHPETPGRLPLPENPDELPEGDTTMGTRRRMESVQLPEEDVPVGYLNRSNDYAPTGNVNSEPDEGESDIGPDPDQPISVEVWGSSYSDPAVLNAVRETLARRDGDHE